MSAKVNHADTPSNTHTHTYTHTHTHAYTHTLAYDRDVGAELNPVQQKSQRGVTLILTNPIVTYPGGE